MASDARRSASEISCRLARPEDRAEIIDLMRRTGVHFAGVRHGALYEAIIDDSLGPDSKVVTIVAELDGVVAGLICSVASDSRRYWRSFVLRHPAAAGAIARTRARKLRRRIRYRRRKRALYGTDLVLTPRVDLPDSVADRLRSRPPTAGSPRPGEHGSGIALVLYVAVDDAARARGVGVSLYRRLFDELRRRGAYRCDCSFSSKDPAAIRMHCAFPFTIYRLPGGYWASLRLSDLDV